MKSPFSMSYEQLAINRPKPKEFLPQWSSFIVTDHILESLQFVTGLAKTHFLCYFKLCDVTVCLKMSSKKY